MTCPSRYLLARSEASIPDREEALALSRHVLGCPRCGAVMAELAEVRPALLGDDPERASRRAVAAIIARAERERRSRWSFRWVPAGFLPMAAALALGLFVLRPALPPSSTRVKGGLSVEGYSKRAGQVAPLKSGSEVWAGDRLRFSYTKGEPGHLMVFGVDDTGQLFPYYKDTVLADLPVNAGTRVMLPDAIELDAHHGWERVYVLWSSHEISPSLVREAVQRGLTSASGDIRRVDHLDLDAEQVSYLLRRP